MGKGLQLVLLAVVFAAFGVVGFFLGDILFSEISDKSNVTVIDEPVVEVVEQRIPAIPVIESISIPVREATGKYSFKVEASVPTGDDLEYILCSDASCLDEVYRSVDGHFVEIAPNMASTYYLQVNNVITGEKTEIVPVKGFVQVIMCEKITKSELEKICNSGDYGVAPPKFNLRIVPKLVIVANGVKSDERGVASIADICQKIMMGTWNSVAVESIEYDSQNRMKKLTLRVNY